MQKGLGWRSVPRALGKCPRNYRIYLMANLSHARGPAPEEGRVSGEVREERSCSGPGGSPTQGRGSTPRCSANPPGERLTAARQVGAAPQASTSNTRWMGSNQQELFQLGQSPFFSFNSLRPQEAHTGQRDLSCPCGRDGSARSLTPGRRGPRPDQPQVGSRASVLEDGSAFSVRHFLPAVLAEPGPLALCLCVCSRGGPGHRPPRNP